MLGHPRCALCRITRTGSIVPPADAFPPRRRRGSAAGGTQAANVGRGRGAFDNRAAGGVLLFEAAVLDLLLGAVGMNHLDVVAVDLDPRSGRRIDMMVG